MDPRKLAGPLKVAMLINSLGEKASQAVMGTLSPAEQEKLSEEDYKNFYRLIGSFRGLSESVVAHAKLAQGIDWGQWKEARF